MNEYSDVTFSPRILSRLTLAHRRVLFALLVAATMVLLLFLTVGEMRGLTWQTQPQGADLGDAPDSDFNHYGITNTAYAPPTFTVLVLGHFPNVWEGQAPSGPRHVGAHATRYFGSDLVLIGADIPHLNFGRRPKCRLRRQNRAKTQK